MKAFVFLENEFQDAEVLYPYYRLQEAGFDVVCVAPEKKAYHGKYGCPFDADATAEEVKNELADVVVIPGGWAPDRLRRHNAVLDLVRKHVDAGKTVASICHGAWVLVSAGVLKGRTVTCYDAIQDDVKNAGARYVDQEVCVDGNLVTSRKPSDLPAFCREILKLAGREGT
ncbi:type 1 glutamine amidotransferase [Candidatus Micrarchaeota archaeon]|nr:type 1 glutamine amidotransferase [Candidatus Micrarchaeota archaeon]